MKKITTLIGTLCIIGSIVNAQSDSNKKIPAGKTPSDLATSLLNSTTRDIGDTIIYFDGNSFFADAFDPDFTSANEDLDGAALAAELVNVGYPSPSGFISFYSIDSVTQDTSWEIGAASWFNPVGQADNWFEFGPIQIPTSGAHLSWDHYVPDNNFRDGYEVLVSTTGIGNYADFIDPPIYVVGDNSAANLNDNTPTPQDVDIPFEYNGQLVWIAFHHNANDQFLLFLDNILVTEANVTSITDPSSLLNQVEIYPNPIIDIATLNYNSKSSGIGDINIYDITGKLVNSLKDEKINIGINSQLINVSNLQGGVYLYEIATPAGKVNGNFVVAGR